MAALDPLGILNADTKVGPDGARRANEKVTRNYMNFGKYLVPPLVEVHINDGQF